MSKSTSQLDRVLADTYALYLKTQNYHWHVRGPNFKQLHELFEAEYNNLAEAIDKIAERIRTLGERAPATFDELNKLKSIADGDPKASAEAMVDDLAQDQTRIINVIQAALISSNEDGDEGTIALLADRIAYHEKARWMLSASLPN